MAIINADSNRRDFLARAAALTAAGLAPFRAASATAGQAQPVSIVVDVSGPGIAISPGLYGIFFEEINHAGEGGLYAEMVQDRCFDAHAEKPTWALRRSALGQGQIGLDPENTLNPARKQSLRVDVSDATGSSPVAVVNPGFFGMAFKKGAKYRLTLYARTTGSARAPFLVALEDWNGNSLASAHIQGVAAEWQRFEVALESSKDEVLGRLSISFYAPGTIWLGFVSLFPEETWKGRRNDLRPDLAILLADLTPAFIRFPGGTYVQGFESLGDAFHWKNSIGDVTKRPGHFNKVWGYWSTDGLGYHEYLQLAEDLGADALYVANCGMAFAKREVASMARMPEWVDDALDAIEYANGPATSKWGAMRAANGHPTPFRLRYVEVGNEDSGPPYEERYALFYRAIKQRFPEIVVIANQRVKSAPVDLVDDHIYTSPERMRAAATRYDKYDRSDPNVFVGEYACNQLVGKGNLYGALAEAGYMLGLERNSDVVKLAAYAPLLYHVYDRKWPVNLIGFDGSRAFGTPSYYVQRLFSRNRGDFSLSCRVTADREVINMRLENGMIGVGTTDGKAEYRDVRVVENGKIAFASDFSNGASGWAPVQGRWSVRDSSYCQEQESTETMAVAGDVRWRDYTLTLKARKIAGNDGFLVLFRYQSPKNMYSLILGGWKNVAHAVERTWNGTRLGLDGGQEGRIETGRWYDIRVEVKGSSVEAFLDGQPVFKNTNCYEELDLPLVEAAAARDDGKGEVVLKTVNYSHVPRTAKVRLAGVEGKMAGSGILTVLASTGLEDENTVETPTKVVPVTRTIVGLKREFELTLEPDSVAILRLKLN